MQDALKSPEVAAFLSPVARKKFADEETGKETKGKEAINWWRRAIFFTMLETSCPAEFEAWGNPDMNYFRKKAKQTKKTKE